MIVASKTFTDISYNYNKMYLSTRYFWLPLSQLRSFPQKFLQIYTDHVLFFTLLSLFCFFFLFIEKVDEIITLVFQYINMLKAQGYQQWVLEEERVRFSLSSYK